MSNWTQADLDAIRQKQDKAKAPKPSKYRNVKVEINGEKFDSKREANYWLGLKMREKAEEIYDLKRQVEISLRCPSDYSACEDKYRSASTVSIYKADFTFRDKGTSGPDGFHVVDAKGKRTALYQLKKKWLELQDGIVIEEV